MLRQILVCQLLALFFAQSAAAQAYRLPLISQTVAAQHGLTRAWATQVEFDAERGRLTHLSLHAGMLFAVTNRATVQAFDPETGRTVWATKVGRPEYPTTAATSNERYVALCNGSTVYVLDRKDGGVLLERRTEVSPSAGPVINNEWVYVPTLDGSLEGYSTTSKTKPRISFHGHGMVAVPPQLAAGNVVWGTAKGFVYACTQTDLTAVFRFATRAPIESRLAYVPPYIVTGSADGFVYAMNATNGKRAWQFSTGSPVRGQPVGIEGAIYAVAPADGMFCLSADRGTLRWFAPNIYCFVAASKSRVYASDSLGQLVVLDAKSGARIDSLPTELLSVKLVNTLTDRICLATTSGLLQCLREIDLTKPIYHSPSAGPTGQPPAAGAPPPATAAGGQRAARAAGPAAPAEPAARPARDAGGDPFGVNKPKAPPPDKPAEKGDNPFGNP
jgi:outer membrane protein assembly factor BamB